MCMYVRVQVPYEDSGINPLELELQVGVSLPGWVPGTETRSSERAVHALNC